MCATLYSILLFAIDMCIDSALLCYWPSIFYSFNKSTVYVMCNSKMHVTGISVLRNVLHLHAKKSCLCISSILLLDCASCGCVMLQEVYHSICM